MQASSVSSLAASRPLVAASSSALRKVVWALRRVESALPAAFMVSNIRLMSLAFRLPELEPPLEGLWAAAR